MKFIMLFEEQTAFDEAKSTLNRPNVSLIKTNRNVYSLTEEGGGLTPMVIPTLTLVSQVVRCGQQ